MRFFRAGLIVFAVLAARTSSLFAGTPPSSDVEVTKTAPATAPADTDVAFSLSVTNFGPDDAGATALNDPIPAGMTFVSRSQDSGPAFTCTDPGAGNNGPINCTITNLVSGATATFTFTVHIAPATPPGTFFTNIATVSCATLDPNSKNDSATAVTSTPPPPSADFFLQKDGPVAAAPDTDVAYTITVGNAGPDAGDATWTDTLPGTMTFVSLNPNAGCTTPAVGAGGTISCPITNLAPSASILYTLTGHVPPATPSGTSFSNTASVTGVSPDPSNENNQGSTTLIVSSVDVAVTKSGPPTVTAGQTATYTLTIANAGPDTAVSVSLSDLLPAPMTVASFTFDSGTSPVSCSSGLSSVSCGWSTLANGQSASFTLIANVNGPAGGATLTNTANGASQSADTVPSNNSASTTATAIGAADLIFTKTGPANATAGQNIPFTLSVDNAGPSPADNVVLGDTLPAGALFVSLTQNTGPTFGCTTPAVGSGGAVTCTLAQLAAGSGATFTLVVRTDPTFTGPLVNAAAASSSTSDPTGSNNTATATVDVAEGPVPAVENIPTLSGALLLVLGAGLAAAALARLRR